jgi:hypothetical protein
VHPIVAAVLYCVVLRAGQAASIEVRYRVLIRELSH